MPFPDGMLTRVVSFPTFVDLEGRIVKCTIRVFSSRPLVWAATGQTVLRDAEIVVEGTAVQMTLPTTDQAGITDGAGNTITDWTYSATYQLAKGGSIPDTVFALPIEDGSPVTITRDVSGLVSGGVVNVPLPVEGPAGPAGPAGVVQSIVAGTNVTVNNTDPANPVISSTGGGGGGAVWGSITGTLSSQTDLQTVLNGKQAAGSYAAAVHTHPISDVTNLQTSLDGKAASSHTHPQSDVTNLTSDLALKAPLASPAFTGSPTAPTPTAGDNDTSVATTAFVQTAKVDATVQELIRDTIWLALIGGTDITISQSDPSDTITIAFSGHGLYAGINAQTGTTYTLVLADRGKFITLSNAGAITVTIPTNATAAFAIGSVITLQAIGTGDATITPAGGVTLNVPEGLTAVTRGQYSQVSLTKRATDTWALTGDLVPA